VEKKVHFYHGRRDPTKNRPRKARQQKRGRNRPLRYFLWEKRTGHLAGQWEPAGDVHSLTGGSESARGQGVVRSTVGGWLKKEKKKRRRQKGGVEKYAIGPKKGGPPVWGENKTFHSF